MWARASSLVPERNGSSEFSALFVQKSGDGQGERLPPCLSKKRRDEDGAPWVRRH